MKRYLVLSLIMAMVLILLMPMSALATKGDNPANDKVGNLYLYEKDANWDIVWDGAWGKFNYNIVGNDIVGVFNGHGLTAGEEYTLITYLDPWAGTCQEIGTATANKGGNIHIAGSFNADEEVEYKVWLVLSSDFDGQMIGWNPSEYLFEHNLIGRHT